MSRQSEPDKARVKDAVSTRLAKGKSLDVDCRMN